MNSPNIRSFEPIVPMIYAYSHPDYAPHLGWTKIGYTEKQTVEERVKQQHQQSHVVGNQLAQSFHTRLSISGSRMKFRFLYPLTNHHHRFL